MNKDISFFEVKKVLSKKSNFKIKTKDEFNKCLRHIAQLISDAYILYNEGSFSTSLFLSITIIEEVGKIHMGLFIKKASSTKNDPLRNHVSKQKIASNYTISLGFRLRKAIGEKRIEELLGMSYSGKFMELRNSSLYCDCVDDKLVIPVERVSKTLSKEILLLAIESFDDNLVGYTNYSMELSNQIDNIFSELSKSWNYKRKYYIIYKLSNIKDCWGIYMNIENYIETQYRKLQEISQLNIEFSDLYSSINHEKLREIFTTLHYDFTSLFKSMNRRLPTLEDGAHFWADQSRRLISTIEITLGLFKTLKNTQYAFDIDDYYLGIINKCLEFLSPSGGSRIPSYMKQVDLYYTIPIFKTLLSITVDSTPVQNSFELKQIGSGSYARVYKYKDSFYNRLFVLKRAKKDLNDKELLRFKREFEEMKEFSSPYILEVYCYNENKNEYIMEYMDYTIDKYISQNNSELTLTQRKNMVQQILRAFKYIHSKDRLHRDISPKNILLKKYDDTIVVKIADFGLVKVPDSSLTTASTEFKGYFNDPSLILDGFDTYNILHETYALTRVIYFVMTGKTNTDNISDQKLRGFVQKGLNSNKSVRFQNVTEMLQAFLVI